MPWRHKQLISILKHKIPNISNIGDFVFFGASETCFFRLNQGLESKCWFFYIELNPYSANCNLTKLA